MKSSAIRSVVTIPWLLDFATVNVCLRVICYVESSRRSSSIVPKLTKRTIKAEKHSVSIFVMLSSSLLSLEQPRLTRDAKGSEAHSD
jgi:hypothetical protein